MKKKENAIGGNRRAQNDKNAVDNSTYSNLNVLHGGIPQSLKDLNQWVMWKLIPTRDGKPTKVPYTVENRKADTTDPTTWGTFDACMAALESGTFSGIGFVFAKDDPFLGVDWDNVRNPETGAFAEGILEEICSLQSYAEISQSGKGAHVICRGLKPGPRCRRGPREMYTDGRFFVMTGNHINDTPRDVSAAPVDAMRALYEKIDPLKADVTQPPRTAYETNGAMTDEEMISLCGNARNGKKFRTLYRGSVAGYGSQSEADQALCNIIAFYTQDENQIDRIFQGSGLYRKKWDRGDYKARTIGTAINGLTDIYTPKTTTKTVAAAFAAPGLLDVARTMQESTPIYYDRSKNLWLWVEDHWEIVDETEILLQINAIINDEKRFLGSSKYAIMDAIKMTGRQRAVRDKPKNWIHLKNGIVDIQTGMRIVPSPEYHLTQPIPHKIGDSTNTPTFDKLFNDWVDKDMVKLLYELCAYVLIDDYPIHRVFLLFGRGRNGKSQFRDILINLVGRANTTSTTLEAISNNRFESARLYKKKIASIGETNYNAMRDTARLKELSGGDPIPAELKGRELFEFKNTAKIIINSNSLPPTTDRTDGFYSRFIQIIFPNQFQNGKDIINTIPGAEYDNLVAKCLKILPDLLDRGEFTNEGDITDKAESYEALSNPLVTFLMDECVRDVDEITPLWHIVEAFNLYLKKSGHRQRTKKETRVELINNDITIKPNHRFKNFTDTNGQWAGVMGIKLKTNPHEIVNEAELQQFQQPQQPQQPQTELDGANVGDVAHVGVSPLLYKGIVVRGDTPTKPTTPTHTHANPTELIETIQNYFTNMWRYEHGEINTSNIERFITHFIIDAANRGISLDVRDVRKIAWKLFKLNPETPTNGKHTCRECGQPAENRSHDSHGTAWRCNKCYEVYTRGEVSITGSISAIPI